MKNIVFLLLVALVYSCGSSSQSSPKALFEKAHQAVLDRDIDALSECITQNEFQTAELNRALAEMIIYVKSGEFQKLSDMHKTRLKETKNFAQDQLMMQAFGLNYVPDFDIAAKSGVYDLQTKVYTVKSKEQPMTFTLDEQDGNWTFWVTNSKPSPMIISGMNFLKELEPALTLSKLEESKKAIHDLVLKHVKPTELEYADRLLSGKMSGTEWAMVAGKASQSTRNGKSRISLMLSESESPADCRMQFPGSNVYLSFETPGVYDFGQTGVNLTLFYRPESSNKVITTGKVEVTIDREKQVLRGRVTARLDDDNFVNGTFEVPICGEIVLD